MGWKKQYKTLREALRGIVEWPPKGRSRRTEDGYPAECAFDEFAYKRMVDQYRIAIRQAIKAAKRARR